MLFARLNQLDSAYKYSHKAFDLAEKHQILHLQIITLTDLGYVYLHRKNYDLALQTLSKAYEISPEGAYQNEKKEVAELLYKSYKAQGELDKALIYLERFEALKDSILTYENSLEIARLEINYAFEKKKQEMEHEQAQEIAHQKSSRIAVSIALCFAILLILLVGWNYYRKQKANANLKALNTKILSQKNKLEELDKVKSQFFANISHELRTPLSLITGPAQSISLLGALNEEQKQYLDLIESNAAKLLKRTNDILDLSKLDSKKLELKKVSTHLYKFINISFSSYESAAHHQQIKLTLDYTLPRDLYVFLDRDKFDKIISNYVSNALKYTGKNGSITLNVREKEEKLIFCLSDTGAGIQPSELPHIFDRYYQASNSLNKGGTGIGLAFCKELASVMKGRIWAESTLHRGSSFYLEIPMEVSTKSADTQDACHKAMNEQSEIKLPSHSPIQPLSHQQESNCGSVKASTVLLVEDNSNLRTYIAEVLKDFHIVQAENGKEAIDLLNTEFKTQLPSLIISDIMMPHMDGHELLKHLKSHSEWQKTPVMMLTALAADESKFKALRTGVDDYLLKPFSPIELKVRAENLIKNYQTRQEFEGKLKQELSENTQPNLQIDFPETARADQQWLSKLEDMVKEGLEKKLDYSVGDLADYMAISQRQLLRKVRALTGLSIKKYVQEIKLQKARHLLERKSHYTVAEVAYTCGFNTPNYFSKLFESRFGKKPSTYIREALV